MAYTTIDKPTDYFTTFLWTGDGSTSPRSHTGVGLQANMMWSKVRSAGHQHNLVDTVRGVNQRLLMPSDNGDEDTTCTHGHFDSLDSDGFTTTNAGGNWNVNASSQTYVGWFWKAGTSFTNSAGANGANLATTAGSVNTDAGFSILKWNSSGMAGEGLLAHGLGVVPSVIIIKATSASDDWYVYHKDIGATKYVRLNQTAGETSASWLENKTPTSTLISLDNGFWGTSSIDYISYCFAEKKGYSKFGSFVGNGSSDGTYVHLGFKPALVIVKSSSATHDWLITDNKRSNPFNPVDGNLFPNLSDAEGTATKRFDFTSQGFKNRSAGTGANENGTTFIYMAFAESPFVTSTGIPTTAR